MFISNEHLSILNQSPLSAPLSIPQFFRKFKFDGEHYWEIGSRGYPLRRIKKIMSKYVKNPDVFLVLEHTQDFMVLNINLDALK